MGTIETIETFFLDFTFNLIVLNTTYLTETWIVYKYNLEAALKYSLSSECSTCKKTFHQPFSQSATNPIQGTLNLWN